MSSLGIVHHPFIFRVGALTLSGYGIAIIMAFAIAWIVIDHETGQCSNDPSVANQIVLASATGALLGAKIFYALVEDRSSILTRGGYSFWGGLLGGACAY